MCRTFRVILCKRGVAACVLVLVARLLEGGCVFAQNKSTDQNIAARQIIADRGEVEIRFIKPGGLQLEFLTSILSIDRVNKDTLYAYVNKDGFEKFLLQNIPYEVLTSPSLKKSLKPFESAGKWHTKYPSYERYLSLIDSLSGKYPLLCQLKEIGLTQNGHKLLVMKIYGNPVSPVRKPAVLLSSSIHGDEPLGFVLLLRLIETLLSQYETNARIKTMLDSLDIWINPLANPDGAYFISDSSVFGATRFNANHVDLNRNFPDPAKGQHPDTYPWQIETVAMMNFMNGLHPVHCANFHSGSEVVNYPWDSFSKLHPDNAWYQSISRQWADTAQAYSYPGYMSDLENGITNGYKWYPVYGGRQDYMNFFIHGREVTIELSDIKIPDENKLENYWNYNYRSLLQFIEQAYTGVSGLISDSLTGVPVNAIVSIAGHDRDNSQVYSDSLDGYFCRLLQPGNYMFDFSADGYLSKQVNVRVEKGRLTPVNIKLSSRPQILIYPNPFSEILRIDISEPGKDLELKFTDLAGRLAKIISGSVTTAGMQEVHVDDLSPGMYIITITYGDLKLHEAILKIH